MVTHDDVLAALRRWHETQADEDLRRYFVARDAWNAVNNQPRAYRKLGFGAAVGGG